jgi:hypothetical protein
MLLKGTTLAPRSQSKMNTTDIDARPNDAVTAAAADGALKSKKRKKDKVRSAWISFVGRIVAQFIGAAATIVLGVMFVQKYGDSRPRVAPEPATTIRFEFVVVVPASRPADQADIAAAVAREVVAATQHAAAMNGSVALVHSGTPAATQ